jgi:hypothetical protein
MQRKKARHKLAKLFRKIGIPFEDTYKFAKQLLKEDFPVFEPVIKIEIQWEDRICCTDHGTEYTVKAYKGPSGIVTTEQILQILRKTK